MRLTFLGTCSGAPSTTRNVSALALQLPQSARWWLFDCGEGTQHQILRTPLRPGHLERVFITHLHGDHLFGLPGLLASRSLQGGGATPVTVYGPVGLDQWLRLTLLVSQTNLSYPLHVVEVAPGVVWEEPGLRVVCGELSHRVTSYGYRIEEADQPGRFDAGRAEALGVPPGPLYGALKAGGEVTLADGRVIRGADLVGKTKRGRVLTICGDTTATPAARELARGADLLVHEATNREAERALADRAAHSTAAMAAAVAKEAAARALLLTHFSARYESDEGAMLADLLAEARAVFADTALAHDLMVYEVKARE